MARVTDRQIEEAIVASGGVVADAARMLGISRKTFYARLKRQPRLQQLLDDECKTLIDLSMRQLDAMLRDIKFGPG